jgi:tetratricopeptide (TPR) repeat protein
MARHANLTTWGCLVVLNLCACELAGAGIDTDRRVRFNQGVDAFTRGASGQAIQIFDDLLQDDPKDVASLYYLGLCYLQTEQYAEATQTLEKVLTVHPELIEAGLDAAIAQIGRNEKTGSEAARSLLAGFLEKAGEDESARALGNFFLGVAEYRLGNFEAATQALGRAAEADKAGRLTKDVLFYQALALARGGKPEEAATELKKLRDRLGGKTADVLEMTPETKKRLTDQTDNLMKQVEARQPISLQKNYELELRLDLGFNYDTNVVLLGQETNLPVNISRDDDFRFGLGTDIRYLQRVTDKFSFGIGGSTFNSWHPSLQEYNVQTYAGRAFLNYALTDDLLVGIQYDYDYNLVDNEGFLSRNRVTPSLRFTELYHEDQERTPLTWSTLFYRYEDRDYFDTLRDLRLDRDGNYHAVGFLQDWNILRLWKDDDRYLHAQAGYLFENNSTQADEFDLTSHGFSMGLDVPLPWELDFNFNGQWTWEDYWQHSMYDYHRREREDFIQRYTWALSRAFELSKQVLMVVRGEIALTLDDSNISDRGHQAIYSYDRTIYGLTFSFVFR